MATSIHLLCMIIISVLLLVKLQNYSCADGMFLWRHYILVVGGLIVRLKENAIGTAVILDFLSCHHQ